MTDVTALLKYWGNGLSCVNVFVSVLPGRIRLRHAVLRDRARHAALCDRLRPLGDLESDAKVGSLLLRYDPADTAMEARVRAEVDAVLPGGLGLNQSNSYQGDAENGSSASDLVPPHRRGLRTRSRINRVAKVGALAGMAASLAALGVSRKLHAQIGVFAASMILTHVAMHWRRVLR